MKKLMLLGFLFPLSVFAACPEKECLPDPENVIDAPELSAPCENGFKDKHHYTPALLTPRIFEKRENEAESESGATYEKGEELYVTGRSPFTVTKEEIEEVDDSPPEK